MSGQRTDGWNFQLSILSLVTVICIIPYHYLEFDRMSLLVEKSILYTLTIIITSLHIHYGIGVVIF